MSSYFVNSLSTCYGPNAGLNSCSGGNFHRNGNYSHSGNSYPSFGGTRYPYASKEERSDDQNGDYYSTPRLSHLPPQCSSPDSMHGMSHNVQQIPANERSSCNIRPSSDNNNTYYPNGQLTGVEENRTPPAQQPPPTPNPTNQQQNHHTQPVRGGDDNYPQPQIYPWMRRMQYCQGMLVFLLS